MRRPRWQQEGAEPDYRFTLANERTFLAWIRTALAILAGGVALDQFAVHLTSRLIVTFIAVGLAGLAAILCAISYARWRSNEQAMRLARPLPATVGIPLLAGSLCAVGLVLVWSMVR